MCLDAPDALWNTEIKGILSDQLSKSSLPIVDINRREALVLI